MKEYIIQAVAEETIKQFDELYAPELVRCKDCKLKECNGRNGTIVCNITGESHNPDWFCADGEHGQNDVLSEVENGYKNYL